MSKSKNWVAQAIPSLDGSKTTLKVTGEVPSGIVNPRLVINKQQVPANVFALELMNEAPGATIAGVNFEQDITGMNGLEIVLVFNEGHQVIAAIQIDRSILS